MKGRDQKAGIGGQGPGSRGEKTGIKRQVPGIRDRAVMVRGYRDLEVWQKSMDLVVDCYEMTKGFPKNETYGLASQLQRAAVSVPANIAEGRQRQHSKEFLQHLSIACGSLAEVETHIQIAGRLDYINEHQINKVSDKTAELGRMLNGLRRSIEKKAKP